MDEVERFGRRTISVCQDPPDLSALPALAEDSDADPSASASATASEPHSFIKEDREDVPLLLDEHGNCALPHRNEELGACT